MQCFHSQHTNKVFILIYLDVVHTLIYISVCSVMTCIVKFILGASVLLHFLNGTDCKQNSKQETETDGKINTQALVGKHRNCVNSREGKIPDSL